ncbi:MAG: hypothetical protein ACXW61_06650 [Gemmatirosa sp.]
MKLSDIMSHAGLSMYAQVALVLFVLAFVVVALRLLAPSQQAALRATARLPLDDPNDRLARRARDAAPEV